MMGVHACMDSWGHVDVYRGLCLLCIAWEAARISVVLVAPPGCYGWRRYLYLDYTPFVEGNAGIYMLRYLHWVRLGVR